MILLRVWRVSIPSSRVGTFFRYPYRLFFLCFHPLKSGRDLARAQANFAQLQSFHPLKSGRDLSKSFGKEKA